MKFTNPLNNSFAFDQLAKQAQLPMRLLLWLVHATSVLGAGVSYSARANSVDALEDCLLNAVGGNLAEAKFSSEDGFKSDHVRPYNLNFPWAPFAITYPTEASNVAKIVICASKHDRRVQARSGGHDYTNKCIGAGDGAVIIDVKNLNQVQVNSAGIATVGAGNRLKDVCEKLHANGKRYMPHANGTIVHASEKENSDLFWAIRGAGASFGIVTSFDFQTKPEPENVINFSFTISSTSPANLSAAFQGLSPGVFFGSKSDYAGVDFGSQIPGITNRTLKTDLTWMGHMGATFKSISDLFPDQSYFYAKDTAVTYSTLPSNSTIDAVFEHLQTAKPGTDTWFVLIDLYGGAANDAAAGATSYPHHDLAYFFAMYARSGSETTSTIHDFCRKGCSHLPGQQAGKFLVLRRLH
ncbi:unnamed protein product [Clonostachys rosea f. rosea IK726]|uniref:Uncharacterized protein n=1 Tax=Clonostachys rosea f. rosea IK726 TaxID=1349383 RepID=A0ACA9U9E6_BIOOC|nr:unnamed protein product [Clonostachys rosea f. rosea IK726]